MKLFDAVWAPSPRRVRIFLAEKAIMVPIERIDLKGGAHLQPPFCDLNPQRQLPVLLLDDGTIIDDSLGICRYFEALQPAPPLFGTTPSEIGLIESWLRRIEHDCFQAVALAFRNRLPGFAGHAVSGQWPRIEQIPELIDRGRCMWSAFADHFDAHLANHEHVAGEGFSMADICALVAIDFGIATRLPDPRDGRLALARWYEQISGRASASA